MNLQPPSDECAAVGDFDDVVDVEKSHQLNARIRAEEENIDEQHGADHVDVLVTTHCLHSSPTAEFLMKQYYFIFISNI